MFYIVNDKRRDVKCGIYMNARYASIPQKRGHLSGVQGAMATGSYSSALSILTKSLSRQASSEKKSIYIKRRGLKYEKNRE